MNNYLKKIALALVTISCVAALANAGNVVLVDGVPQPVVALCGDTTYFAFVATSWCKDLQFSIKETAGIGYIFVNNEDNKPTLQQNIWASTNSQSDVLTISRFDPNFSAGLYYIGVYGNCLGNTNVTRVMYNITATSVSQNVEELTLQSGVKERFNLSNPNSYQFFQFCVEDPCASISFELTGCSDPSVCPENYALPIVLVSKTKKNPGYKDFSWSNYYPFEINHDDPYAGPGRYYGNLFSWCNPKEFCSDPTFCFPCSSYIGGFDFNLTITVTSNPASSCAAKSFIEPFKLDSTKATPTEIRLVPNSFAFRTGSNGIVQANGAIGNQKMNCSDPSDSFSTNYYYYFDVTDPCQDVNVTVFRTRGQHNLLVSRAPVYYPSYTTVAWMDYWWGNNHVLLSHTDENFVAPARYYVLVTAWCGLDATTYDPLPQFDITVEFVHPPDIISSKLSSVPIFDSVSAGSYQYYHFCLPNATTVDVNLNSLDQPVFSAGSVANVNYTLPELLISTSTSNPTTQSKAYRLDMESTARNTPSTITLTGSGHFFVSIFGRCFPNGGCSSPSDTYHSGSCPPCSNYPSRYAISKTERLAQIPSTVTPKAKSGWSDNFVVGLSIGMLLIGVALTLLFYLGYSKFIKSEQKQMVIQSQEFQPVASIETSNIKEGTHFI